MNIYIKIEIETRELLSRLLLGMHAATQGHEVLIGDDELLELVQKNKLNPGIILEKSITPAESRIKQLEHYKKNDSIITSIDEEGGLLRKNIDVFLKSRFSEKTVSLTDKIFCWGNYDFNSLIKLFPKQKKKFIKTGNPRVSLWKKEFQDLFTSNEIKKKKYIFISSNFGIGVSSKRLSNIVKYHVENNYFDKKEYEKDFYQLMSLNIRLLFEFVSAINYLTDRFPNFNFIIRPHPSESVDSWKNFFKKKKNLEITKKYTHSDWIENCEIVLHNGCTAGIEAFVRNKKIISFKPLEIDSEMDYANEFGYMAKDQTELGNLIERIHSHGQVDSVTSNKFNRFVERFGDIKYENFVKNILIEWQKFDNINLSKKNNLIIVKMINKMRLIKNIFFKPYFNNKFPPLDKEKIIKMIKMIKKTDNSLDNVNFELIGPKLFKLKLLK